MSGGDDELHPMLKKHSDDMLARINTKSEEVLCPDSSRCGRLEKELQSIKQELQGTTEVIEQVLARANQMTIESELASIELLQLFNASYDGIWVVDKDFTILRINKTFQKLLKKPQEEVVGRKCYEIFKYGLCASPGCPVLRIIQRKEKTVAEDVEVTQDDQKLSYILNASPFKGLEGEVTGVVSCYRDITDRKNAELLLQEANKALERVATIDGLTQISNRRRFDEYLAVELKRAAREKNCISLILCDVDWFKLYNDVYGHLAGDSCLQAIAQALKKCARRPADLVARYGGEEFAVVLPNTPTDGAMCVAEAIRCLVLSQEILHSKSLLGPYVTLSLGVESIVPSPQDTVQDFINHADQALYAAKKAGRNRVIHYTSQG